MSDKTAHASDRFFSSQANDQPQTALEQYQAATLESSYERASGIRITFGNSSILQVGYAYHKYALSGVSNCLILVFTFGAIVINGQNLRLLLDGILEQRIRELQPFDANRHRPTKESEPVIHTIRWYSMEGLEELVSELED